MRPEPIFAAVEAADAAAPAAPARPGRAPLRPGAAPRSWPRGDGFSLLCGRYEGVDHRVREHLVDGELSVGDVVLGGGEVAACLVIEAVTRLLPGAMGNDEQPGDGELRRRRAARGAAVHPSGRVPRLGRARRAAQRRPRPHRALAPGAGAAPHARAAGPTWSRPRRAHIRGATTCWKSSRRSRILDKPLRDRGSGARSER